MLTLAKYTFQFTLFSPSKHEWYSGGSLSAQWWGFPRLDLKVEEYLDESGHIVTKTIFTDLNALPIFAVWELLRVPLALAFIAVVQRWSHSFQEKVVAANQRRRDDLERAGITRSQSMHGIVDPREVSWMRAELAGYKGSPGHLSAVAADNIRSSPQRQTSDTEAIMDLARQAESSKPTAGKIMARAVLAAESAGS